jgi:microcystin-dependent protein
MSVSSAPDFIPVGSVFVFAGLNPPNGYLICDGREVLISDYQALYSVIGNTFYSTPTEGHFVLPDMRDNMVLGVPKTTGDQNPSSFSGGNATLTVGTSNLPTVTFTSCGVTFSSTPHLDAQGKQPSMITSSANDDVLPESDDGKSAFNADTATTVYADITMSAGTAYYSGGGQSKTAPLTGASGSLTFAGIQLTYIIKAFNPLFNFPQPDNTPVTILPPVISTATNPNLDNPLLSGYIYSV